MSNEVLCQQMAQMLLPTVRLLQNMQRKGYSLKDCAVLGEVYIKPSFRAKGHAQVLVKGACCELIKVHGMRCVGLIPDPFEIDVLGNQKLLHGAVDYKSKKSRLIKLYQNCGFVLVPDKIGMILERKL